MGKRLKIKKINKAIFLDRDGVINKAIVKNKKPYPPNNLSELKYVKGIRKLINTFKKNYFIIIITNQPDFARGIQKKKNILEINNKIKKDLHIDKFYVCFHDNLDNCSCRKPKAGSFLAAQKKYKLNFSECYMIGDRRGDIIAANRVKIKSFFLDYGYNEKKPECKTNVVNTLEQVINLIIKETNEKHK